MTIMQEKTKPLSIPCQGITLSGFLTIPQKAKGTVIFVHGSGSSRLSPRNQSVADVLNDNRFATLLFDLLTDAEANIDAKTLEYRFDIAFLSLRLMEVTEWLSQLSQVSSLPIGYFGASTGAAAAIHAAAQMPDRIKAIVSRGGRPDLAGNEALDETSAATLLLVGERDPVVIDLNETAFRLLNCEKKLQIVKGATHLFEEPGTLEEVSMLATQWFSEYL